MPRLLGHAISYRDFNDVTVTVIFVERFRFKEYRHKSWNEYVHDKYEMSEMKRMLEKFSSTEHVLKM